MALNIGFDGWQPAQVQAAYDAAIGSNVKMFISYDFSALPCDVGTVVTWINRYKNHQSQFLVNGKPMISSFLGECLGESGWASIKAQTNGFLMPFVSGLEGNFNNWPSLDSWLWCVHCCSRSNARLSC
jgi:glucan endo-1,3-alpha-glucosidase